MNSHDRSLWRKVQLKAEELGADPGPIDGLPGRKTAQAVLEAMGKVNVDGLPTIESADPPEGLDLDDRTRKNIETLHEKVRPIFEDIARKGKEIAAREIGGDYRMISGNRTWDEQNDIYAQGRTKPGPRRTNAPGGYSNHNFGIAGDFGVFDRRGDYVDESDNRLAVRIHREVATWAKAKYPQVEWGGDWESIVDTPHFQIDTGKSLAEMRDLVKAGKSVI